MKKSFVLMVVGSFVCLNVAFADSLRSDGMRNGNDGAVMSTQIPEDDYENYYATHNPFFPSKDGYRGYSASDVHSIKRVNEVHDPVIWYGEKDIYAISASSVQPESSSI